MADSARAEARRRKILQNSQNRLQKITGRVEEPVLGNGNTWHETPLNTTTEDTTDDSSVFITNNRISKEEVLLPNTLDYSEQIQETTKTEKQEDITTNILTNSKLHIVILAVLIQIISIYNDFLTAHYLFLPLAILECTQLLYIEPTKENSMLITALTLSGLRINKIHWILRTLQLTRKFIEDACLYLFVFVILQSLRMNFW